jgi:hypothetical protein
MMRLARPYITNRRLRGQQMDALLQQLIDLVKQTAPQLWIMALKQIEALNSADTMICWVLGGLLLILILLGVVIQKISDSGWLYWFIFGIASISIVSVIISNIYLIRMRTMNPEYYAIQVLMQLVK